MSNNSETHIDKLVKKAEQFERDGLLESALECWRTVLNYAEDPITLCRFGRAAMRVGKSMEAQHAFESALKLDPDVAVPHTYLGLLFRDSGNIEEAVKHFESSASLEANAAIYTLLGTGQLQLGRLDEARLALQRAININPEYEEAYYNLGITLAMDEPDKAITLFTKAVQLDPEYAEAQSELGQALRRINKNSQAEYHLKKAVELDNTDGWAYLYLANISWINDDLCTAENYFQTVMALWPNSAIPLWSLAMFYQFQGRMDEAGNSYHRALSVDPDDAEAYKRFAIYLNDIGQVKEARAYLERAFLLDPADSSIPDLLAELDGGVVSDSVN